MKLNNLIPNRSKLTLLALFVLGAAACDSGPTGPGALPAPWPTDQACYNSAPIYSSYGDEDILSINFDFFGYENDSCPGDVTPLAMWGTYDVQAGQSSSCPFVEDQYVTDTTDSYGQCGLYNPNGACRGWVGHNYWTCDGAFTYEVRDYDGYVVGEVYREPSEPGYSRGLCSVYIDDPYALYPLRVTAVSTSVGRGVASVWLDCLYPSAGLTVRRASQANLTSPAASPTGNRLASVSGTTLSKKSVTSEGIKARSNGGVRPAQAKRPVKQGVAR